MPIFNLRNLLHNALYRFRPKMSEKSNKSGSAHNDLLKVTNSKCTVHAAGLSQILSVLWRTLSSDEIQIFQCCNPIIQFQWYKAQPETHTVPLNIYSQFIPGETFIDLLHKPSLGFCISKHQN